MLLRQLAQHVGEQIGNFRGNALRAVQPRHGRKEGAEDESHRVDEEEFFRCGGFCHRREYSKAARAAGVCYFIRLAVFESSRATAPMPKRAKDNTEEAVAAASAQPEAEQRRIGAGFGEARSDSRDADSPPSPKFSAPAARLKNACRRATSTGRRSWKWRNWWKPRSREKRHLIVEAGTGTGKTLAYLIPAIRSGRRVVISTATKSLQEQLFEKDIPFLQKHFAPELKVAVMKGRGNFLCREKVYRMADQPDAEGPRRTGLVPPDSRLGKSDGHGRPRGTQFSARRFRPVAAPRCAAGRLLGIRNARSSTAASSRRCTSAPPRPT